MRIAVVGAAGQLGAAVVHELLPHHEVIPLTRSAVDITDAAATAAVMARIVPEAIVNCAAYNNVDGAEDHPVEALQVNALAVRTLARAAIAHGAVLVHWSTDFVFDGTAWERPYREDDRPNPRSVYAASKLLGEWFAMDAPRAYVLRVESLFGRAPGGPPARGSVAAIVNTVLAGGTPRVFSDRTVSPTYVPDAASAVRALLERGLPAGLYHCVNSGYCTWLEFATTAAKLLQREPRLEAVSVDAVTFRAARPKFCALANARLASVGIQMPSWQDALARYTRALAPEVSSAQGVGSPVIER
jgi:dTDP-4-dehydrorhamnose reductase